MKKQSSKVRKGNKEASKRAASRSKAGKPQIANKNESSSGNPQPNAGNQTTEQDTVAGQTVQCLVTRNANGKVTFRRYGAAPLFTSTLDRDAKGRWSASYDTQKAESDPASSQVFKGLTLEKIRRVKFLMRLVGDFIRDAMPSPDVLLRGLYKREVELPTSTSIITSYEDEHAHLIDYRGKLRASYPTSAEQMDGRAVALAVELAKATHGNPDDMKRALDGLYQVALRTLESNALLDAIIAAARGMQRVPTKKEVLRALRKIFDDASKEPNRVGQQHNKGTASKPLRWILRARKKERLWDGYAYNPSTFSKALKRLGFDWLPNARRSA